MFALRSYQVPIVERAVPHNGYGLFMEQRTGKTPVACAICDRWGVRRILIVCPKKAILVWEQWILGRDLTLPSFPWTNPVEYHILNFETVHQNKLDLKKWKPDVIIVDESHRIKERSSRQTKACWNIAKTVKKRLVLTGTPIGNEEADIYPQLRLIRPDLFPTWGDFQDRFCVMGRVDIPNGPKFDKIVGYKNLEELRRIKDEISSRVTRDEVQEKPTKVQHKFVWITLDPQNRVHYQNLEKKLITELAEGIVSTPLILTNVMRLHQLCGGHLTTDEGQLVRVGTEKLDALRVLLTQQLSEKNTVIVARFKAELLAIRALVQDLGWSICEISGKHQYDPSNRTKITLLQPKSGLSIDLSYASSLVIFSHDYSFLDYSQFKDRIVLVGTERVTYYHMLIKDSADEDIYECVKGKKKISDHFLRKYHLQGHLS